MPAIEANGIEIDFEERGASTAAPLLLIRGLGTQRTAWPEEFLAALLERGHRVITFDNRDAGLSTKFEEPGAIDAVEALAKALRGEPVTAPYSLDDMALDTIGLLDALDIDSTHVAGISMGGMIAQLLAARHGDRLRSLTSIMSSSGAPGLPGPTPEAAVALLSRPENPEDRKSVIRNSVELLRVIGSPGFRPGDAYLRATAEKAYDRCHCPDGVARQTIAILTAESRTELLETIRVPTLVIHGQDDPLIPVEAGIDTAKRIPKAELLLVPGMGHDVVPGLAEILVEAISAHTSAASRPG